MRRHAPILILLAALLGMSGPSPAQPASWSPEPWLGDLAVMRTAIETKYANLEWLLTEREFDLGGLFDRAGTAMRGARSDTEAVAILNRVISRIGDGHVTINWPRPTSAPSAGASAPETSPDVASFCRTRGFGPSSRWVGPTLTGYASIENGDLFPAGLIEIQGQRAGIVRIAKFEPGDSPSLCPEAIAALNIPLDRPCDEECSNRFLTQVYRRLTESLEDRLTRLRAAGARVLIVDVSGNGGGSEWVQAAVRMLSARQLVSQRLGFVRGPHWAATWTRTTARLREFARTAGPADRRRLLGWAAQADAARVEAQRTCPSTGGCPWLGNAGFATGLVGSARSSEFAGKDWAPLVFNPAQYPYRDGIWDGPLVVLVDDGTASAAEEFAAMLQDNRAALVVGSRTVGSGCGHTWGGTPTILPHSGATLLVPDCARLRADGSNEVRGVIPDLMIGWRAADGGTLRAHMLEAALSEAAARASELYRKASRH